MTDPDIRKRTETYVAAFDGKDLAAVAAHFDDAFELTDPEVTGLTPKAAVLAYIEGLFDAHPGRFSFEAERILVDGDHSAIEFVLTLGDTVLRGVDIIAWRDGRMVSMRAHLTQSTPS